MPGGFLPADEVEERHLFESIPVLESGIAAAGVLSALWHDLQLLFSGDFPERRGKVLPQEVQDGRFVIEWQVRFTGVIYFSYFVLSLLNLKRIICEYGRMTYELCMYYV